MQRASTKGLIVRIIRVKKFPLWPSREVQFVTYMVGQKSKLLHFVHVFAK